MAIVSPPYPQFSRLDKSSVFSVSLCLVIQRPMVLGALGSACFSSLSFLCIGRPESGRCTPRVVCRC